ncbi:hypothetical protein CR513_20133, partial [Mucuna pruriens]
MAETTLLDRDSLDGLRSMSGPIRNEVQVAFHVNHSEATSVPAQQPCHSRVAAVQVTARVEKGFHLLGTKKQKVTRGDRLVYQRTLVDLILNVLANGGGPSPSTMTIVFETEIVRLCSVCLHSAETKPDRSLPRSYRLSLCRERLGHCRDEPTTRNELIKLASLLGIQVLLSNTDPLYAFDLEIELTLHRLRKFRNIVVNISSSSDSAINSNLPSANALVSSSNIFTESGQMENNDRTLKELATPNVVYQPWCIQYPQLEPAQTYELKSGLIHLLPKFHGLAGEDPHKHLKEFHVVCSTMRP